MAKAASVVSAPLQELRVRDFSGGLNLRDSQSELGPTESPDLWNVTLDERGGIAKRLGYIKYNPSVYGAAIVQNLYYWPSGQAEIVQAGASLYKDTGTTIRKTFTTGERVGFADFNGVLYVIHPTDGLFSSTDGVTYAAVAGGPKGCTLATWQNRLFAAGDPTNKARLYASKIGDATNWLTTAGNGWTNDLREKDGEPIVCLAGAPGIDIAGRPGLLVFKRRSTYRVYDSSNGAFQTVDAGVGAASSLSVTSLYGRTLVLSERGIFWTDGVGALREASEKLQPLFDPISGIAYSALDNFAAGVKADRAYFSLTRAGGTVNNLEIEYHPIQGWMVTNSAAASCYSTYGLNTEKLLAGSPTVNGQAYERFRGGSDDGTQVQSWFQTRWFEPAGGIKTRMRRLRFIGRGSGSIYVRKNFEIGSMVGTLVSFNVTAGAAIYDDPTAVYDMAGVLYGPLKYEDYQDFYSLGVANSVSFRIEETSSAVTAAPAILGTGASAEAGAWGLYGADLMYVGLGIA